MKKVLACILVALMFLTVVPAVFAEETEPVKVYYWDGAIAGRQPSEPEEIEKVREVIIAETGVDPQPYIPVVGATDEQLSLLLAGDDPLDEFLAGSWREYAAAGLIVPINDLLEEYGQDLLACKGISQAMWDAVTDSDGNIWGVPRYPAHVLPRPVQIRSDWLEKYDLSMPTTIEELEHIFEVFKAEDPSGDGSTISFLTDWGDGFVQGFLGAYIDTGSQWWLNEEGILMPYFVHPNYKDALAKYADWFAKGYIYPESFQADTNQRRELLQQGRVGVYNAWYSTVCNAMDGLHQNVPEADYLVADQLVGDNGCGLATYAKTSENCHVFMARAEHPEEMMKFINWQSKMYTEHVSNSFVARYGYPETFNYYTIDDEGWSVIDPTMDEPVPSQQFYHFYCPDRSKTERLPTDPYYENKHQTAEYMWCYLMWYGYDPVPYPNMGVKGDDYSFAPDTVALNDAVPFLEDINRMVQEEGVKFITGQRSIDTFDDFVNELYKVGLQDYIDEYNRQYKDA